MRKGGVPETLGSSLGERRVVSRRSRTPSFKSIVFGEDPSHALPSLSFRFTSPGFPFIFSLTGFPTPHPGSVSARVSPIPTRGPVSRRPSTFGSGRTTDPCRRVRGVPTLLMDTGTPKRSRGTPRTFRPGQKSQTSSDRGRDPRPLTTSFPVRRWKSDVCDRGTLDQTLDD